MQLILVRHALPVRQESAAGRADPLLALLGTRQADAVARWLAEEPLDAIVSSPMLRARQTAEPLAQATGLRVHVETDLEEYDAGRAAYVPLHEIAPRDHPRLRQVRSGELPEHVDVPSFRKRVLAGFERVADTYPGRRSVACFCHAGVINIYLTSLLGIRRTLPFPIDYVSLTRVLAARDGRRVVRSMNEVGHLRCLPTPDSG